MTLNDLHKAWIQHKVDIIDWIIVIGFSLLALALTTQFVSAKTLLAEQQKQISEMQKQLDKYKHRAVVCQTLKQDPLVKAIMRAR